MVQTVGHRWLTVPTAAPNTYLNARQEEMELYLRREKGGDDGSEWGSKCGVVVGVGEGCIWSHGTRWRAFVTLSAPFTDRIMFYLSRRPAEWEIFSIFSTFNSPVSSSLSLPSSPSLRLPLFLCLSFKRPSINVSTFQGLLFSWCHRETFQISDCRTESDRNRNPHKPQSNSPSSAPQKIILTRSY